MSNLQIVNGKAWETEAKVGETCQGAPVTFDANGRYIGMLPCTKTATVAYDYWRFGKGDEPVIVHVHSALCAECNGELAEHAAEAAAEARMS